MKGNGFPAPRKFKVGAGLSRAEALKLARKRSRRDFRGFTYNRRTGWATLT